MEMPGERRIPAPRDLVWKTLNDPEALKACVPGCEAFDPIGENEYEAKMKAKVGPVKATFTGKVLVEDIDAPNGYRLSGEGQGGVAGFAKGGATVKLTTEGDETVLVYEASAQIGGKLAQIGSRLVKSSAEQYATRFFDALAEQIAERAEAANA